MDGLGEVITFTVLLAISLLAGGEVKGNGCGEYAASEEVCEQVVARADEVGTVPAGHEQRERARGQ